MRAAVSGHLTSAAPTRDELAKMETLVKDSLAAGCVGVSTGLGYPPGIFADEAELAAFAGWAAESGRLFTSHLKSYTCVDTTGVGGDEGTPGNIAAIEEILRVADQAQVRVQISHLIFVGKNTWPTVEQALRTIEEAERSGVDVAFDAFPYTAGNTTASVLFPPDILPRLEEVLSSPEEMDVLKAFGEAVFAEIGFHLEDIQIMNANADAFDQCNGLFVGDAARDAGMDVWEFYARLVLASRRNARVLIHKYSGDRCDEEALRSVLAHPLCTIETDTFVTERGHQNPASYGTFPRVLSTYVEAGMFSFEEAVAKMTGRPAARLGWQNRGILKSGAAADLVVLERANLRDRATFDEPSRFPDGIERVWINGVEVFGPAGYNAGASAGKVLRA